MTSTPADLNISVSLLQTLLVSMLSTIAPEVPDPAPDKVCPAFNPILIPYSSLSIVSIPYCTAHSCSILHPRYLLHPGAKYAISAVDKSSNDFPRNHNGLASAGVA